MSNKLNNKLNPNQSWADMEESDDDNFNIENKNNLEIKEIIIRLDQFEKNINIDTDTIYSFVNIRIKNLSYIGLNNLETKNNVDLVKNFENIKAEIYYPKRNLKIFKIYRKLDKDKFESIYNTLQADNNIDTKLNLINEMFQYYFLHNNTIYFAFFKVGDRYYDIIKKYEHNKIYEVILYPVKL